MNIPWNQPQILGNEAKYLKEVVDSNWLSSGVFIERFETEFTNYVKGVHGLAVSNGTTALQLALLALDVGPGDEVIVPGFGFIAAANMVIAVGATPVFCDVDEKTWLIDPSKIEQLITKKTKAILPIHTYGSVCDMDAIMSIAKRHSLFVIEDNAESVFSKINDQFAGTFGHINTFSFQSTKTITMGEGGFVVTADKNLAEKMKLIRSHGMSERKYWHVVHAYNFRLTNMQAAIGCAQLEKVETVIKERKKIYDHYLKGLKSNSKILVQEIPANVDPVMWTMGVRLIGASEKQRDQIMAHLKDKGIETRPGFYPCRVLPFFKSTDSIPVSEKIAAQIVVLPFYVGLEEGQIDYICRSLAEC